MRGNTVNLMTGHFSLKPFFDYARSNSASNPWPLHVNALGYRALIISTITDVPRLPGWYWWGRLNDTSWEHMYVGKTGNGEQARLKKRLYDELREEEDKVVWVQQRTSTRWRGGPKRPIPRSTNSTGGKYCGR